MVLLTFNVAALSEPIDKIIGDIADDILVVAAENNPPGRRLGFFGSITGTQHEELVAIEFRVGVPYVYFLLGLVR